jgi:hypothetical protein
VKPWGILGIVGLGIVGAVLVFYGRALERGFTSEDFLLLRLLHEDPPWHDLLAKLASPWLGLQLFKFYRPVATLLFGLEDALFGTRPFGYNLAHTLVHAGNAFLVFGIVRGIVRGIARRMGEGETDPWTALAAALLFALYPLHPNAVVFAASFATIFATAFLLAAFRCHQIARERSSRPWELASLLLFALALGSYEAAVVLPVLLVAHDLLLDPGERRDRGDRPDRGALVSGLPFCGLLGFYFLLRHYLFGVFLGGYEDTGRRLLAPHLRQLLGDLGQSLYRLYVPVFEQPPERLAPLLFLLLAGLAPLLYLGLSRARRAALRPWLFGWIWTIVSLAPFAFRPVVPGNGRYWYLAAIGAALAVAFLARALVVSWRGPWRVLPVLAVVALLAGWATLLVGYLKVYVEAGRTARSVAAQLESALRRPGGAPVFVASYPGFLENGAGVPVAQVFHYGLADAVSPPFAPVASPVYPLPPLAAEELKPLLSGRPTSRIFEWEPGAGRLRQVIFDPSPVPFELTVLAPADGALLARNALKLTFRPGAGQRFRLVVLARGNPDVVDLAGPVAVPGPDGAIHVDFPRDFLLAMDRLYGSDFYWWIESRDERGQLLWSRMRSFSLAPRPSKTPRNSPGRGLESARTGRPPAQRRSQQQPTTGG